MLPADLLLAHLQLAHLQLVDLQLLPPRYDFYKRKSKNVAGTRRASFFGWENRYLQPARPQVHAGLHILGGKTDICKYRSQVHAALHILCGKIGTCYQPGLRYMLGFIFWVGLQVPATGQASAPHIFLNK